jgi:hypothetical protein
MTWILCSQIAGKPNDITQPARARVNGWSQPGPVDRGLCVNVMLAFGIGESRETAQQNGGTVEGKSARATQGDVRLHSRR